MRVEAGLRAYSLIEIRQTIPYQAVEQFEPTASQSMVSSPLLEVKLALERLQGQEREDRRVGRRAAAPV